MRCGAQWLTREVMLEKLKTLEDDLIRRKGKGWKEAKTKWRTRVDGLWTIGVCGVALSVVAAPLYLKADLMHQRRQEAMAPLPLGE